MQTALSEFSKAFALAARPVIGPCDRAVEAVESIGDGRLREEVLPLLMRHRSDVRALLKKVEGQDSYVLIFGPLKSGKSTLMNSLAGAYVSEVTSLPAYPCVVYVSDAPRTSYRIRRYDGSTQELAEPGELSATIELAHSELARALRAAESEGLELIPERDLPSAIRDVNVELPAGDLSASHTVLVDTPGLYSRMKFGYASMTREFRHAAAVAIFVVKADSIFLEQVFQEFTELLDIFSRIFLVLNVDSTKRDVGPDGRLRPSLEQTDPRRLVHAFEDFSMNARMKQAEAEGRLKIYPIDLLQTAAARLRGAAPNAVGDADNAASFERFYGDLIDFLSSSDYLKAFVRDSLTRADVLLGGFDGVRELAAVEGFRAHLREREQVLAHETARLELARALSLRRWEDDLSGVSAHLEQPYSTQVERILKAHRAAVDSSIQAWYLTDDGFTKLASDLRQRFARSSADLDAFALKSLAWGLEENRSRLVSAELEDQLRSLGVDLLALAREALKRLEAEEAPAAELPVALQTADVPVKRSLIDWLFLRGAKRMRRKLFGHEEDPSRALSPRRKRKRLGDRAKDAIRDTVDACTRPFVDARAREIRTRVHVGYVAALADVLRRALANCAEGITPRVQALSREVADRRGLLLSLDTLAEAVDRTRRDLARLGERAPAGAAEVELRPFRRPAVEPAAAEPDASTAPESGVLDRHA